MAYVLNNSLILGDLLFTRGDQIISKIIASTTNGPHSHVAIYIGNGIFVEATPPSVRQTSAELYVFENLNNTSVKRIKDAAIASSAAHIVQKNITKLYTATGAIATIIPSSIVKETAVEKTFCSHLIAECYKQAGIDLLNGRDLHKINPNELSKSEYLEEVESVFSEYLGAPPKNQLDHQAREIFYASESAALKEISKIYWDTLAIKPATLDSALDELTYQKKYNSSHFKKIDLSLHRILSNHFDRIKRDLGHQPEETRYIDPVKIIKEKSEKDEDVVGSIECEIDTITLKMHSRSSRLIKATARIGNYGLNFKNHPSKSLKKYIEIEYFIKEMSERKQREDMFILQKLLEAHQHYKNSAANTIRQ